MKTLSEHSEYGIIGTSYYLLRFALIVIPVIIFCYSIYVDSLLGDGLWSSAVGVGPLAVTCILTIFSIVSAVLAVLFFFQILSNPIIKYIFYIVTFVGLLFYCIDLTFFTGNSYYDSLQDVTEYCQRFNGTDAQATEWTNLYNNQATRFEAIDFVFIRTLGVYNAMKTMFAIWSGSFLIAIVFGTYLNQKLEQKTVVKKSD